MFKLIILTFLGGFLFSGMSEKKITLTGSSTVAPLVQVVADQYQKESKGSMVEVQTGGSSKGISDCKRGLNDLGMISRELKDKERNIQSYAIAKDGLAFITHKANAADNLKASEVRAIYAGQTKNWIGSKEKITVISKAEGRGALELFKKYFGIRSSEIQSDVIVGDEAHTIKAVASVPGSIGFVSVSSALEELKSPATQIKVLKIDGIKPNKDTIKNESYPYLRRLQLIACDKMDEQSKKFVAFLQSSKGQSLVEKAGYLPL